jgi:hypothetical protein
VRYILASKQISVPENSPYSPDLAPNYFFSVPEDIGHTCIERNHFDDIGDIRRNMAAALKAIP